MVDARRGRLRILVPCVQRPYPNEPGGTPILWDTRHTLPSERRAFLFAEHPLPDPWPYASDACLHAAVVWNERRYK